MRSRIDEFLEHLGRFTYRHAWLVLATVALLVGLGASRIPTLRIEVSTDAFLRTNDATRITYDAFLEQFGRDDMILIAIEPPEVFDFAFLERLRAFHEMIEDEVPHVREVRSLINARETRGVDDGLIVGELFEDWPRDEEELASIRARALANPLYVDFILSESARLTTVTIELEAFSKLYDSDDAFAGFEDAADSAPEANIRLTGEQETAAVAAVQAIVDRYQAPDFRIYAGGSPVLNTEMMTSMLGDIALFTALSTALIAAFLTVVFRRLIGVVIPLSIAIASLVSTLGLMATIGIPLMPISEIVPSFLLSMGVGASVHLIAIFLQRIAAGATREDAVAGALAHSGLPIIMTCLTTAGGLASFSAAKLIPVAVFGTVAPLGILVMLVLTLLLAPAMLRVLPLSTSNRATAASQGTPPSVRVLIRFGEFATTHAHGVLLACSALVILALVGTLRLQVSFDNLEWFPDDMPAKIAVQTLDRELGGSMALEILIDTAEPNGLHDPAVLHAIDRARRATADLQLEKVHAGKSVSLVDVVKEIHQALNEGRSEARIVPNDRALISQELVLFESSGSDDLEDLVDSEFRTGRMTMRVPYVEGGYYPIFGEEVARIFEAVLPEGTTATLTGLMMVMGRSFSATIETIFRSYMIALAVITPLMILLLGSFRLGLIAMIPNLFPIVLTLGLMGWTGQPLEMFSLLIGSIALGLAVDDTIHFMHGFRKRYADTRSVETAVQDTLQTTGQALLFTSIVLSFGFLIYVFSDLKNLSRFGVLTSFSIVVAFLADVLLAPALMKVTAEFSSIARTTRLPSSDGGSPSPPGPRQDSTP